MTPFEKQEDQLRESIASLVDYQPEPDPVEWLETHVYLDGPTEIKKGPLNLGVTPYLRGLLRLALQEHVTDITLMFGTQLAKTLFLRCLWAYLSIVRPGPGLWIFPSDKQARAFTSKRIDPLVDNSPLLVSHKPLDATEWTKSYKFFGDSAWRFSGSFSTSELASEPARYAFVDEADKVAAESDKDADAINLAHERTKNFDHALRPVTSSPTTEDAPTAKRFEGSSQHRLYVPCPHCGHSFVLDTPLLKWDPDARRAMGWDEQAVMRSAHIECPACKGEIWETQKPELLDGGEWRQENEGAQYGHIGAQLGTLYSPFVTWGEYAVKFLQSKDSPGGLQNFTNGWEGLPYVPRDDDGKQEDIKSAVMEYGRGERMGKKTIGVIDVQREVYKLLVRGYDKHGCYLIDHIECHSKEQTEEVADKHGCYYVGVDTGQGERTNELYQWVAKNRAKNWIALKGVETFATSKPFTVQRINPYAGKNKKIQIGYKIQFMAINTGLWRPEIVKARTGNLEGWHIYRDPDPRYVKELFGEYPRRKKSRFGKETIVWVPRGPHDWWDCEVYQRAMAAWLRLIGINNIFDRPPPPEDTVEAAMKPIRKEDLKVMPKKKKQGKKLTPVPKAEEEPKPELKRYIPMSQQRQGGGFDL